MFGDDLTKSKIPVTKQLIEIYKRYRPAAVVGVQEVPWEEVSLYGTVKYKPGTKYNQIESMTEKADKDHASTNMAQFGRFIFSHKVIDEIKSTPLGKDSELWVADMLNRLARKDAVIAQPIEGRWLTTGDPLHFLKATIEFALDRPDLKEDFKNYLKSLNLQ
jgi:UTP--glucose-1-phosphate uridylyltransferase